MAESRLPPLRSIGPRSSTASAINQSGGDFAGRVVIVGGGAAGLAAAYSLKQRGISPILLEAKDKVGGRLRCDRVDGFCLDEGADFFCSSYDVVFRLCEELGLPLVRSEMNLGWYRSGRWVVTMAGYSARAMIKNLRVFQTLGPISPAVIVSALRLVHEIRRQSEHLNFASDCRLAELDGEESFGEYLDRLGVPETFRVTLKGFLEMTMGEVEPSGAAYMRTYVSEMFLKNSELYVPERGAGSLSHALADACGDVVRVSAPVRRVLVKDRVATTVILDDGSIEADAVICAVPATRVPAIIPDLPADVRSTLGNVNYSTGCRVVIGLDRPPLPVGWHGALYPEDGTPLLLDQSINLPDIAPPGKSTLDLLVGRDRAEELLSLDDEEIKRQLLSDARRNPPPGSALPDDDEGIFTRVYRWKEAVCMAAPGMFQAVAEMRRRLAQNVDNLFLAGDYMSVPSVNGALASGVAAAETVADRLKTRTNHAAGNERQPLVLGS